MSSDNIKIFIIIIIIIIIIIYLVIELCHFLIIVCLIIKIHSLFQLVSFNNFPNSIESFGMKINDEGSK